VTHQGAACDAASVHFGQTIGRTDVLLVMALDHRNSGVGDGNRF